MLLNLGIIGCFILSAVLVFVAVNVLVDLAIPEPLRKNYKKRCPAWIKEAEHAWNRMHAKMKKKRESRQILISLKELHR